MGISMLGGIVSSIVNGINGVLNTILSALMKLLVNTIIMPVVTLVIGIINYVLGLLWYSLSCFLLGLIDYVEILFRLLAGLSVEGVQMNLTSSSVKGGDLVIQLIMTKNIRDVFLSMCIVGIFLLVITTIFQIIKVEYTTEGAKNAKGPILNKAFKGLCNMIMIPALCICGVFIGNKVLDLLDTATSRGEGATISGTLFTTAASQAFYGKYDIPVVLSVATLVDSIPTIMGASINLVMDYFSDVWGSIVGNEEKETSKLSDDDKTSIAYKVSVGYTAEENGTYMDYHYYNPATITQFYDYSKINYLLLIFGACIVIKTLYFACFGMIVRLYQCGMLFIISPAVIGMTPINESGLGKWRSEFVGQVISAYGVVMALNIFFTLVEILLSISIDFSSFGTAIIGADLMEGLLKSIIVIGGCLTIEKFSTQIGGYFGAKDALAQGKEMEKGVKDQAKKAISTGITVAAMATGAGGAAMGATKGLAGAMKVGSAAAKASGGSGFLGGLKAGASHVGSGLRDAGEKGIQQVTDRLGINFRTTKEKGIIKDEQRAQKGVQSAQAALDNNQKEIDSKDEQMKATDKLIMNLRHKKYRGEISAEEFDSRVGVLNQRKERLGHEKKEAELNKTFLERDLSEATTDLSEATDKADKMRASESDRHMIRKESWREAGISGWKEKTFGGQIYSDLKKKQEGYEKSAVSNGGAQTKAAAEHLAKEESDAAEKGADDRNKHWIAQKDKGQEVIMAKLLAEQGQIQNLGVEKQVTSAMDNLDYFQQKKDEALANGDKDKASRYDERLIDGIASVAKQFGIAQKDIVQGDGGKWEITASAKADIMLDPDKLAGIAKKAFADMRKGMKQEEAIKNAVEDAISGKSADYARMIQKAVEEVLARWDKGK